MNKCIFIAKSSNESSDYNEINYNSLKNKLNTSNTSKKIDINKITLEFSENIASCSNIFIDYNNNNASYSNTFIDVCISFNYYIII
jgi:hypothetical protein